jgi:hypothetical protein
MTTWHDAVESGANPWQCLDGPSVGGTLAGQGTVTAEEKAALGTALQRYGATQGGLDDAQTSAAKIAQCYDTFVGGDEGRDEYLKAVQQQPLGDLEDPQARLKAMSFLTQNVPMDPDNPDRAMQGDNSCGGASLVGAAFLAEGPAGLSKLVTAIEGFDPSKLASDEFASDEYKALKKKLADGGKGLTVGDIQTLQQMTTQVLNTNDPEGLNDTEHPRVANITMDRFLEQNESISGMMKDNGMQVEYIDSDGKRGPAGVGRGDHYVLKIKGPDGQDMIYDPNARRGGQIIDCAAGVEHYNKATVDHIGDDQHPYANYAN